MFEAPVYKIQMEEDGASITYSNKSKECEMYLGTCGKLHNSNHIKYVVDLSTKTYEQHCYSHHCKGLSGVTKVVPERFHPSIEKYMKQERETVNLAFIFEYRT
jgi:hypothetical protein